MHTTVRRISYLVLVALLVGAAALWLRHGAGGDPAGVSVGGPFTLEDQTGRTVTDQDFRGKWMLIYFGYTFCPDVCPTELQSISTALDQLGPDAVRVVPLFVSIDPERDTPQVMADYVKLFDDRIIGLTGTAEQVAAVAKAYRVYYAKVPAKDGNSYLMDHSAFLYLIGPDGSLRGLFRQGLKPADLADQIHAKLAGTS